MAQPTVRGGAQSLSSTSVNVASLAGTTVNGGGPSPQPAGSPLHAMSTTGGMQNYRIVSTIGRGNFGVCHLCECTDPKSPATLGKMFVIKQINMGQLSDSEKEGAVQEVKLLSELHHPFIVGYKESFLEGEVLNIVMNYCLAEDQQLLTNKGFMFLEEVEKHLHALDGRPDELLFATLNPASGHLEYHHATSLIVNAPGAQMIDMTAEGEQGMWAADSDKYGRSPQQAAAGIASPCKLDGSSSGVSLVMTADHDMYVRRGKHVDGSTNTDWLEDGFMKQKAGTLLSSDPLERVQLLAHARSGIQQPLDTTSALPFSTALSLRTPSQIDSFLQLYGLWLGCGRLDSQAIGASRNCVQFETTQQCLQWATEQLTVLGYARDQNWSLSSEDHISLLQSSWFDYLSQLHGHASPVALPAWCWQLPKRHVRLILDGMTRASTAAVETELSNDSGTIHTSSALLRDDLIRACLHAGYAAQFHFAHLTESTPMWAVTFTEASEVSSPTLHSQRDIRALRKEEYTGRNWCVLRKEEYTGRNWCVTVPPHNLIIARRAHVDEDGVVTKASAPVVVGNCEGGDLTTLIKQQDGKHFSEEQILDWFIQLCLSLRYIHQRRIIHRDLKSGNVFLTKKKNIRLGDFGIARVLNGTNELAMSVVGTPYSMSPEVCENKPYSFKSDIWALGCVLYELCTLKHAFDAHNLLGLVWKIVSESYPPIPDHYTPELVDLVSKMLAKDPAGRPSIDAILDLPFIRARLHSQIRAKMNLKTNKQGTASGKRPTTGSAPNANATAPAPASPPQPPTVQIQRMTIDPPRNLTGTINAAAGPTGTLRARPTLDVQPNSIPQPIERIISPLASPSPTNPTGIPNRASSAVPANRAPPPSAYTLASPHGSASARGPDSMLSPSDRLANRKKAEADARARELTEAARQHHSDRLGLNSSQRVQVDYRGGPPSGRPSSSIPSSAGPYGSAFDEDVYAPRQRSASSSSQQRPYDPYARNDGSYSGRTPTKGGNFEYPPYPSPSPAASLDDRPIKSSGAYRLGGNAPILSPAAQQAARMGASTASTIVGTPPSSSARLQRDDSDSEFVDPRPNSVSSNRVTRTHDADDSDSYSSDDFDSLSDEDNEIVHELERTYTSGPLGRPLSSTPASTATRPTAPASSKPSAFATAAAASQPQPLSSPLGSSSVAPSMMTKHAAIKEKCLRSMSEAEFNEVYGFIRSRMIEAQTRTDGSKDLTKEELAMKFGARNQEIVFQIEQLVYLSNVLDLQAAKKAPTASSHSPTKAKPTSAGTAPKTTIKPTSAGSTTSSRLKK